MNWWTSKRVIYIETQNQILARLLSQNGSLKNPKIHEKFIKIEKLIINDFLKKIKLHLF